jgi:amino-acid N-acetyltransferase
MRGKPGKIRRAGFADIEAIYEIIRENLKELIPRSYPDLLQNFDRFLVYEREGRLWGVISWRVLPILNLKRPDRALEVISFSVRPEAQEQGIGSALLRRQLRELGAYRPDRILVLTFYPDYFARFGFRETSKARLYPKIYLGCIECTKYRSPLTCPEVAMEIRLGRRRGNAGKARKRG